MNPAESDYDEQLALARDELARVVRRLRSLSPHGWESRQLAVRLAVGRLGELAGLAEQRSLPHPPELPDFALPDAIAVIASEAVHALETSRDGEVLSALVAELRSLLEQTR